MLLAAVIPVRFALRQHHHQKQNHTCDLAGNICFLYRKERSKYQSLISPSSKQKHMRTASKHRRANTPIIASVSSWTCLAFGRRSSTATMACPSAVAGMSSPFMHCSWVHGFIH